MGLCLKKRLLIERPRPLGDKKRLWVHCASVGEFNTVLPILKELKRDYSIALTYFSPRAEDYLREMGEFYDLLFPLPLDLPPFVRWFERFVRPERILIVERELWPSLIAFTRSRKVLLNARSGKNPLEGPLVRRFSLIIARTERDEDTFRKRGAGRVVSCGNLKVVQEDVGDGEEINPPYKLFVAGSTREGEERIILKAFQRLREEIPLRLVLAPRHIKRAREVGSLARSMGFRVSFKSLWESGEWDVLVLDTLGELRDFYRRAWVTFVGGTFAPVGGHNLLEPAMRGKPVLFGPSTHKVRDIEELLVEKGYGFKVRSVDELIRAVYRILKEGFKPRGDLRSYAKEVKACYLRELRLELL